MSTSLSTTPAGAAPDTAATPEPRGQGQVPLWRCGALLLLTLAVGLSYLLNPPLDLEAQSGVVLDLPVVMGDYIGKKGAITPIELHLLPADTEFARRYYDDSHGHEINCSIVLSGAEQRSIHRPEGCLTGQGWTIVGQDYIPISLLSGHQMEARKLTLERRVQAPSGGTVVIHAFYIYWFVGQNVTTASEMHRVLLSNWDRVVHNKAHRWAYVSVFSLVTDNLRNDGLGLDQPQTESLLVDFLKQVVPTFQISEMPAQAKN